MERRDFFKHVGLGSASAALLSLPIRAHALSNAQWTRAPLKEGARVGDGFVILLEGPYQPVTGCPDFGLSQVNLCDGSFSKTEIYPVSGLKEDGREQANRDGRHNDRDNTPEKPIGTFYVQFGGMLAAYDLPSGALTMVFTGSDVMPVPDEQGGTFFIGTYQLDITEATGIYQSFLGGHNKMVDRSGGNWKRDYGTFYTGTQRGNP
jgi:hypothetical protein